MRHSQKQTPTRPHARPYLCSSLIPFSLYPAPTTCAQYTVEIEVGDSSGALSLVAEELIICRYVRREIRSLTEDDRNRFFDAAKALLDLDTDPTIAKATNWTKGLAYYVRKHLRNAIANKRSDRMHDGMGFLTQVSSPISSARRAKSPAPSEWQRTTKTCGIVGLKYVQKIVTQLAVLLPDVTGRL